MDKPMAKAPKKKVEKTKALKKVVEDAAFWKDKYEESQKAMAEMLDRELESRRFQSQVMTDTFLQATDQWFLLMESMNKRILFMTLLFPVTWIMIIAFARV